MANDVTILSTEQKAQLIALYTQIHEANEKRFVQKPPVATLAAMKAILVPEEGETRQLQSELPKIVMYVFNTASTTAANLPDDGTTGGWLPVTPTSTPDTWVPNFAYAEGDMFVYAMPEGGGDLLDFDGNVFKDGGLYLAEYVDGSGDPVAVTSGAAFDGPEALTMRIVQGEQPDSLIITQAMVDSVILDN